MRKYFNQFSTLTVVLNWIFCSFYFNTKIVMKVVSDFCDSELGRPSIFSSLEQAVLPSLYVARKFDQSNFDKLLNFLSLNIYVVLIYN